MRTSSVSTSVVVSLVVAALLAVLASFGVYSAAQPKALVGQSAEFKYGQK